MKYQFSKQIRLSFVSFIKKHSNLGSKWCQKCQITPEKFWILSNRDSFKRWIYQVLILKGNTNSQTAVLNVVISVKIQEKIQKKKKNDNNKKNYFTTTKTTNSTKTAYITTFFMSTQLLSRSTTSWAWNFSTECQTLWSGSKESISRKKKLKTLKSRKLKQKHIRKSLYELFGFWKYSIP